MRSERRKSLLPTPPAVSNVMNNPSFVARSSRRSFESGKLTAIMGGSGSGKSTLLNAASLRQDSSIGLSGKITFGGKRITSKKDTNAYARSVGFVPQDLELVVDANLTCAENIYFQSFMRWNDRNPSIKRIDR